MLLEISIIVGSVMGGITIISLSALSYVKRLHKDDVDFEQRERDEISAERARKIQKEKEEYDRLHPKPPEPPKPAREESLPVFKNSMAYSTCPLCGVCNEGEEKIPNGRNAYELVSSYGNQGLDHLTRYTTTKDGPSTPAAIMVKNQYRLWQCCTECYGDWLVNTLENNTSLEKKEEEESK